jgi:hypothetical protein
MKKEVRKNKSFFRPANRQGSILAFSLILMFILMVIAIGVSTVSVKERGMSSDTGKSVRAYQIADTGMEKALQEIIVNDKTTVSSIEDSMGGCTGGVIEENIFDGSFGLFFYDSDGNEIENCDDDSTTIEKVKSRGKYEGVFRAVEVDL